MESRKGFSLHFLATRLDPENKSTSRAYVGCWPLMSWQTCFQLGTSRGGPKKSEVNVTKNPLFELALHTVSFNHFPLKKFGITWCVGNGLVEVPHTKMKHSPKLGRTCFADKSPPLHDTIICTGVLGIPRSAPNGQFYIKNVIGLVGSRQFWEALNGEIVVQLRTHVSPASRFLCKCCAPQRL